MRSKIIGTGSYVPKRAVTNKDLAEYLDTSDEWIRSRTGIRQRLVADATGDESCSRMGLAASQNALAMAGIKASDIDLIITATITPDFRLPSVSCAIQDGLGAIDIPAFDLAAACAGSIYGLSIADSFLRNGYRNILLVASEVMSSVVNWHDRNTAVLFGDGASAAVISASDSPQSGFIDFDLYADGRLRKTIYIPAGGSYCPLSEEGRATGQDKLIMNGRETFKFAVRAMCDAAIKILLENNIDLSRVTYVVPHQANLRIIEAIATRLKIPLDRFLINLDRCANTSAASLLLAYDEALRANKFKSGDIILMLAIGAGFAWGAGLYQV